MTLKHIFSTLCPSLQPVSFPAPMSNMSAVLKAGLGASSATKPRNGPQVWGAFFLKMGTPDSCDETLDCIPLPA